MELGLEPGTYTVQYQQDPGLFDTSLTLGEDDRVVLNQTDFQPLDQEQTTLRGVNTTGNPNDEYRLSTALIIDRQNQPFRGLQFSLIGNKAKSTTSTLSALRCIPWYIPSDYRIYQVPGKLYMFHTRNQPRSLRSYIAII